MEISGLVQGAVAQTTAAFHPPEQTVLLLN